MIRALALLPLLALAACGKPAEPKPTAPVAAATEATIPADAIAAQPAFTVSEAGLGPITEAAPWTQAALARLFPDARVQSGTDNFEGEDYPVIDIRGDDGLDLRTTGEKDRILSVLARGGPVVGPRGERIGDGWAKGGFRTADCQPGVENDSGKLFCRRSGQPRVAYVYETPGVSEAGTADNDLPSEDFLKTNGVLTGLIWNRD